MDEKIYCEKLNEFIEFSLNRKEHIVFRHPELENFVLELKSTIKNPDNILINESNEILLLKWFESIKSGKFIVVVVIIDIVTPRKWIVTAYLSCRFPKGKIYE